MDEEERETRQQLMIVTALLQAMDRREEVFQIIEQSEDGDEALRRVSQLLGVGELGSRFVLDLQAKSFTRERRRTFASYAEELRSRLPDAP